MQYDQYEPPVGIRAVYAGDESLDGTDRTH